jgi:hypothetical protein
MANWRRVTLLSSGHPAAAAPDHVVAEGIWWEKGQCFPAFR